MGTIRFGQYFSTGGNLHITKHSRGIHNAWQFWFELALVFTAQWFRLGGSVVHPLMRRYALC
ncbi:hypothetical protein EM67_006415 [Vibrio parahaemolyticus]|nr:hypothetical protein EM67_006415 [Vibrio parahaemolyticus]